MNMKALYQEAINKNITVDPKGNPLMADSDLPKPNSLEQEAYLSWIQLPNTIRFLNHIHAEMEALVDSASALAMSEDVVDIRLIMVQHNKLKEILDYARRDPTSK